MTDGWGISCKIAPRWMPLDLTDDKSTLVQVMAWCRQATSHYWAEPMLTQISVTICELTGNRSELTGNRSLAIHAFKLLYIHSFDNHFSVVMVVLQFLEWPSFMCKIHNAVADKQVLCRWSSSLRVYMVLLIALSKWSSSWGCMIHRPHSRQVSVSDLTVL